jgi:hypothetical protein
LTRFELAGVSTSIEGKPDASDQSGKSKKPASTRTRTTRLTFAITEARQVLLEKAKGLEPSASAVFDYLANDDETGVIVDSKDDALIWVDTKGNLHDTKKRSIANSLSTIKKNAKSRLNPA